MKKKMKKKSNQISNPDFCVDTGIQDIIETTDRYINLQACIRQTYRHTDYCP